MRLPRAALPHIVETLSAISDEDYLRLRAGLARHWRAFVWDRRVGGRAYDVLIASLAERARRIAAGHITPLRARTHAHGRRHHHPQQQQPPPHRKHHQRPLPAAR